MIPMTANKFTKNILTIFAALIVMLSAVTLKVSAAETDTDNSTSQSAAEENPSTGSSTPFSKALGIGLAAVSIGAIVHSYKVLGIADCDCDEN